MNIQEHPTVRKLKQQNASSAFVPMPLDSEWLREICLEAGADDVGFIEMERPELEPDREMIKTYAPWTKSLIAIVCRMNREPIRTPARSVANLEFHEINNRVNEIAHEIVKILEEKGVRAINPSVGFPMEMNHFPERIWVISHKLAAVAAGLGQMGIHRNVIHPKFGNFILLGTILMDAEVTGYSLPIDFNPCLSCKLCVSVCPVGAIKSDGEFNFSACYTHNYKEFMGGFTGWVEDIADSKNSIEYRKKVNDSESVSMWQSLSFSANYKAAYCMAVCPAGEDVISPFLADRSNFVKEIVNPLQQKQEPVYVVPDSDAEAHVKKRFPNKKIREVRNPLRPTSVRSFLKGLQLTFQRDKSTGLNAAYHFTFTGKEEKQVTITIHDKQLQISDGHTGKPDLGVTADSGTWIKFIRKETNIARALILRKIKLRGNPKLLLKFGKCFLA